MARVPMDLLELALDPRKASQRLSPFSNELPKGQARKLEYYFGDRASDDIAERVLYGRDASTPPATLSLLLKRDAWAVVRPNVRGELLELLQFAKQNGVPIVPRGAGTSGYGGSVPTEGGVVVDMRGFNKVLEIDKEGLWVRCEGNVSFSRLEEALREHGLTLRQYPTSFHAATVAGWLAQGGGGVGSAKYGPFRNDIVRVKILSPDGRELTAEADDLDLVSETFGGAGFIVEVTLKVRPATQLAHFLGTFDSLEIAQTAARRALLEAKPYNVILLTQEYAELVNAAAKAKLLPAKNGILVTLESADAASAVEVMKGIVLTSGGTMAKEADAQKAWDNRFNHLNLKRLGPSVVVAEAIVSAELLPRGMAAAARASRIERSCMWAIAVSPGEFDLIYYGLDDERRGTYPLALGNALAVVDAVKSVGGRSYSTGVLASNEAEHVLDGGSRTMAGRAIEPARGITITIGAILGALLIWAPMALLASYLVDAGIGGGLVQGVAAFWASITQPLGGGMLFALVQGVVIGTVVGLVIFGGLVVTIFQRGEPILNTAVALGAGGAIFVLLHLVGLVGSIGFLWALVVAVLSGALGTLWILPLAVTSWFAMKHTPRLKLLHDYRAKTDRKEIFNPGPVLGARTRIMPLPVHDWNLQLRMTSPLLKMQRGIFAHAQDPQFAGMQRALGKVHAGELGTLATEVTTCIFCGMCNAVAPEARTNPWESAQPRGRVQLAKAVIEGRAVLSPRVHRNVAWTALEHGPDAICPTLIPIQRVTDLLLAQCVKQFGPLPEHAGLAEQYAGKDRNKWVTVGFDPVSTSVFLADDVAAFEANDVAQNAALALLGGGYPVGHMGKDDAGSGAALFETGQRVAAEAAVAPLLEKLAKRGARTIVTPDANAARAIALDWPLVGKANEVAVPEVLHTTTIFADLIKGKKLEIDAEKKLAKKVVFHAPEGLTPAQRAAAQDVAKALSATLLEVEHAECGHGRALKLLDESLAQKMAETCLKGAMKAGAEIVLTASPGCYQSLRTAAKKAKAGVEVLDLHVVLAQAMRSTGGALSMAAPAATAAPEKPAEPEIPPDHFRVEFVKEGVVLAVHKNANLLAAGADAGLDLPSSCKAGSCDTCSAKYEGTPADQSAGTALTGEQQKTFVLTCIARPRGPIKLWSDERPK